MSDLPNEHIDENIKLEDANGYVDLFKINLRSGAIITIKANNNVTWQGDLYEGYAVKLTGVEKSSDEKVSRPLLQVANPKGIFSPIVRDGDLNRATVSRYRVLRAHIENDQPIYQMHSWTVTRVTRLTSNSISVELREQTDGQNFLVPARMFIPPEFPLVSLQ